ncbi:hypothetical protein LSCM1_04936 [Leishmania martiniquensis]|uniref:Uncharacterized protein n=1 Tax=Leishmania martiniquensis TaxID=1580590 RepID=A0A836HVL9_9TRYP|nr:hypothetical protein LSCM1_04936 [Leishmania martiniquensis]
MHVRFPSCTKTVGDVLCFSSRGQHSGTERPQCRPLQGVPLKAPAMPPPPPPLLPTPWPGKARRAAVVHEPSQRSRSSYRPVDEALFCALRMESEGDVLRQLRAYGLAKLIKDFRALCSSLSLHNLGVEDFTFLCASVLQCQVQPHGCEVVFDFLRGERTSGGCISVVQLLERLRTLFEPIEVLYALQLKCLLETSRLDDCNLSFSELEKAEAGLRSLLVDTPRDREVGAQCEHLGDELRRMQLNFSVPVPTFRLLVRLSARALQSAVHALGWDGKMRRHLPQEDDEFSDDKSQEPLRAFDISRITACTLDEVCNESGFQDRNVALLSAVAKLYHRRLAGRAESGVVTEQLGSAPRTTARAESFVSAVSPSSSKADPAHPRFTADVYAVLPTLQSSSATNMVA